MADIVVSVMRDEDDCDVSWSRRLRALATEAASKLDVLALDGDTLGVDSAQVGVFKERDEVSLNGFLEGTDGRGLEAQVGLEVLCDFTDKTLEGKLADQELGGLLVTTDLTESDSTCDASLVTALWLRWCIEWVNTYQVYNDEASSHHR